MDADRIAGATANLESIARCYAGFPVVVHWVESQRFWGAAFRTPAHGVIRLNRRQTIEGIGLTFFHEIGHLVLHYAEPPAPDEYVETEVLFPDLIAAMLETPEKAGLEKYLDCIEDEAIAWAAEALAAFEAQFGPFPIAVVG